jgi:DNA-binding XRE family transcriptional regulator
MTKTKLNSGAAKLRMWLVKHGVPQSTMARTAGVSNSTMVTICAGRSTPTLEAASRIANATDGVVQSGDWLEPYTGPLSRVPSFRKGRRGNAAVLAEALAK